MAYQINKGADRPPQIRGVIGMDYITLFLKWIIGIVLLGGVAAVFLPFPGWMVFLACLGGLYVVYLSLVKRSVDQGPGGHERIRVRKRLPGIITVRHNSVYRNLRKK